ncbi:MAG: iron ABC transporter permease [Anaerolineales bacterium]|nr:iron ABC transporter permease [Anaerolineales bacterium]
MRHTPFLICFALLIFAIVLSIGIGSVFLSPLEIWNTLIGRGAETAVAILWKIRLPRTALVLLTGAGLGISGASYQGLFRNPLADPYLIGIASGAGLGAVVAMSFQRSYSFWGLFIVPLTAFVTALLTVALVYAIARIGHTVPTTNLILAGVAVSSFATSLTSFLMLLSSDEMRRALGWLLGGSIQNGWTSILAILPFIALGVITLLSSGYALNLLQFGDDQAQQLGLNVTRTRTLILIAASLVTAASVSFSGIIGFVGLVVPHLMRMWVGADYRKLLSLSLVGGAFVLLIADVISRVILAPQEIPVGIVTALAGAPFFLWILRRAKNQGFW